MKRVGPPVRHFAKRCRHSATPPPPPNNANMSKTPLQEKTAKSAKELQNLLRIQKCRLGGPSAQNNGRGKTAMTARVRGPFHNKIIIIILLVFLPSDFVLLQFVSSLCFPNYFLLLGVLLTFPSVLFRSQRFT